MKRKQNIVISNGLKFKTAQKENIKSWNSQTELFFNQIVLNMKLQKILGILSKMSLTKGHGWKPLMKFKIVGA